MKVKDVKNAYHNWLINSGAVDDEEGARRFAGSARRFAQKVQNMTGKVAKASTGWQMLNDHVIKDDPMLGLMSEAQKAGFRVRTESPIPPEGGEGMTEADVPWGDGS